MKLGLHRPAEASEDVATMIPNRNSFPRKPSLRLWLASGLIFSLMFTGCFLDAKVEPYYGRVAPRRSQEFHWSNGGLPQTFDPAFAAAPPDTDLIRAIFEGLTEYDPKTLTPVPAVATRWEPSNGGREWTFYLRDDARWSNGESVTAGDFVRSWRRIKSIGDLAPHTGLLANIVGAERRSDVASPPAGTTKNERRNSAGSAGSRTTDGSFGATAISDRVLRVRLRRPDMNFPALVAHPVFRPVKIDHENVVARLSAGQLVSNGAFSVAPSEGERVLLQKADNYWDKQQVSLERVEFVGAKDAESAVAAYRAGEVDAVTNAAFEPLAIKLLAPYEDFRRTTYAALTYYSFNKAHEPFDDVRVREALTLGFDRERISKDDLGGATEPAKRFLPDAVTNSLKPVVEKSELLEKDYERARKLLEEAGFPNGEGFPKVRLLINRNEQQRVVAQSIAAMWLEVLNIETEIIIRPWDEYTAAINSGDYDVVRRGIVMQTTDELTNIRMLFPDGPTVSEQLHSQISPANPTATPVRTNSRPATLGAPPPIETESQALNDLSVMPVYFASSYALVKPYVTGFDSNVLDAPSLKAVRINTDWKH
ncbi:MAG TPA: peptide ABC transporter substrate-binding protein [Pyrinomonadaceae bacterium]|nr:peptide ABC transporter substrate-binding protein [Pyrinomonadaceae bacterium]